MWSPVCGEGSVSPTTWASPLKVGIRVTWSLQSHYNLQDVSSSRTAHRLGTGLGCWWRSRRHTPEKIIIHPPEEQGSYLGLVERGWRETGEKLERQSLVGAASPYGQLPMGPEGTEDFLDKGSWPPLSSLGWLWELSDVLSPSSSFLSWTAVTRVALRVAVPGVGEDQGFLGTTWRPCQPDLPWGQPLGVHHAYAGWVCNGRRQLKESDSILWWRSLKHLVFWFELVVLGMAGRGSDQTL